MNRPRKKILRKFVPGLQQLKQLAEQYLATGEDEQNVLEGVGICGALFALTDVDELVGISIDAYDLVECLAQNWPEYSGNPSYPVPTGCCQQRKPLTSTRKRTGSILAG